MIELYNDHFDTIKSHFEQAMAASGYDFVLIHSGAPIPVFMDDMAYPYKVNPYFKYWLPVTASPNSWLVVSAQGVQLIYLQPQDFWHKVHKLGEDYWTGRFDIKVVSTVDEAYKALPLQGRGAVIADGGQIKGLSGLDLNPDALLASLDWQRAYKTDYELAHLREANRSAIVAHKAAEQAFRQGASEARINNAYLSAIEQTMHDMPYQNIVALNENCAILHYTEYQRQTADAPIARSFLIDAGAQSAGYAADITRTYVRDDKDFHSLIAALDEAQLALIDSIAVGMSYPDLHHACHRAVTQILMDANIVTASLEEAMEKGLSRTFFPHGLGHFLGLQVHDVGGHLRDPSGARLEPDARYPALRCTRTIEPRQVFTIEPGLYFIDSLLDALAASDCASLIDWNTVALFKPFGGIRIEDNIIVHEDRVENITRSLW